MIHTYSPSKYFLFLLAGFLLSVSFAFATEKNSIIRGMVFTSDGQPAAGVTILLQGSDRSEITDEDGNFSLRNIRPGNYGLEISLVGYQTQIEKVNISDKQTVTVNIHLQLTQKQLETVVVSNSRKSYIRLSSDYVSKMKLKDIENPQVYSSISKQLLTDQLVFSADDAMKNATGISKMWEATGRSGDGGSYYNSRGFILQSQLRNGMAGNISGRIDAANLESIEVIKGPSATLFGSVLTSYGGLINRVTKKPYDRFGGEVNFSAGSYGFNRLAADFNSPLDSAKSILLRVNAAYNYSGSFQDNGFSKSYAFAPSLSYKINDRLSFLIETELYSGRNLGSPIFFFPYGQTIASLGASRADQLKLDYNRSFAEGDLSQQSRNSNYFGQMQYKISDEWASQTLVSFTNSWSDGPNPYFYLLSNAAVTGNPDDAGSDYISRNDQFTSNSSDQMIEVQQYFTGVFSVGGFRNRFTGGLDFFSHHAAEFFSGGTLDTIPSHGDIPGYRNFNPANLNNLYATKGVDFTYPVNFISNTYSAFASDLLNITGNLMVLAALRADHFVNLGNYDASSGKRNGGYDQTSLSPKFGIVYQPVKDQISVFGNYQNSFRNQDGSDAEGRSFLRPEQANQLEAGVKLDLTHRLSATISWYSIRVKDILRPDAANPNFSIQDGTP